MGAYTKLLKQAYEFTTKYKMLWANGLFLSALMLLAAYTLVQDWPKYLVWTIVLVAFLFSMRLIAAQVVAIKAILDKQQTSWLKSFFVASLFYGRIVIISFAIDLGLLLCGWILIGPFNHPKFIATGMVIYVPIFVILSLFQILAPLYVVIYDLKVGEAMARSSQLLGKYWSALLGLFLILLLMDLPALFLGEFMVGLRRGLIFSITGGIVFLLYQTWFMVFAQVVWQLIFQDLIKPQKLTETQPVIAPEVVS